MAYANEGKILVTKYLNALLNPEESLAGVKALLAKHFHYKSPLGESFAADDYLKFFLTNPMQVARVDITQILAEGSHVVVLYTLSSKDKNIKPVSVTEWFQVENGQINAAISTFDATHVRESLAQI